MSKPSKALRQLVVFLTKPEFSVVWSIEQFQDAEEYQEEFKEAESLAWVTPGFEDRPYYLVERYRRIIRWLHSLGFKFAWLVVDQVSGSITRLGEMCEPGNEAYLDGYEENVIHFIKNPERAAIELEKQGLEHLSRVMWDIHAAVVAAKERRIMEADPEVTAAFDQGRDEILSTIGLIRREQKGVVN